MPQRVQRQRTKGWRMPEGAACVDRSTIFGNPFEGPRAEAVRAFRMWLRHELLSESQVKLIGMLAEYMDGRAWLRGRRREVEASMARLRGKNLCCWCPLTEPCHADVLLEIANAPLTARDGRAAVRRMNP